MHCSQSKQFKLTQVGIMPLTYGTVFCLISRRIISMKMGMFFQEITSVTEFPGSNFLFGTGSKWDSSGKFATCYC